MKIQEFINNLPNISRLLKVKRCIEAGYNDNDIKSAFYLTSKTLDEYKIKLKNNDYRI